MTRQSVRLWSLVFVAMVACGDDDGPAGADAPIGGADAPTGGPDGAAACGSQASPCVVEVGVAETGTLVADAERAFTFTPATAGSYTLDFTSGGTQINYANVQGVLLCDLTGSGSPNAVCCLDDCTLTMRDGTVGMPLMAGQTYYLNMYGQGTGGNYSFTITGP